MGRSESYTIYQSCRAFSARVAEFLFLTRKPGPKQGQPLLDEQGVTITRTHLNVRPKLARGDVRIVRFGNRLTTILLRRSPIFHLMIGTKTAPAPVSVFMSLDAALMKRVEGAINRMAERRGAEKTST